MEEQENNNFKTTLSKWRQLSVVENMEQTESVALVSMSGDSSNHHPFLEKSKEDNSMLVPEYKEPATIAIMSAETAASSEFPTDIVTVGTNEKQELIKRDDEDTKEADEDTEDTRGIQKDDETEDNVLTHPPDYKDKEKMGDNVDSVFLRSPPPHKARSTAASTVEEEDCGIKCLYYTLQCCDCVLM